MKSRTSFLGILLTTMLLGVSIEACWDPQDQLDNYQAKDVFDEKYRSVKQEVTTYLKNSWCSKEKTELLMDLTLLTSPKLCVEVGVFNGSSTLPVATVLKLLDNGVIYAIDAWDNEEAVKHLSVNDPNRNWWASIDMLVVLSQFKKMVVDWSIEKQCILVKKPSCEAVNDIPDGIDFLHLDGDYSEYSSVLDVELYLPKVKTGGYVLLSNLYITVFGIQPKKEAFCKLFDQCDLICDIDNQNTLLFRKR